MEQRQTKIPQVFLWFGTCWPLDVSIYLPYGLVFLQGFQGPINLSLAVPPQNSNSKRILQSYPGPDKYGECPYSVFPSKDMNVPLDGSNDQVNNTKETPSTYLCWFTDEIN
ncbi:hypothetical protein E5288_WYG014402 [Bos mutus]|uniref:Uncharacterized protein n=1 Tax=Bos mutus TaxID=72004 RepID=A0A6B0RAV9_9CETA|nr:hypothetical protein [Bos mutus]